MSSSRACWENVAIFSI